MSARDQPELTEVVAGRYRLERKVASGGMGEVFAALDESTGQRVALKRMRTAIQAQRALVVHFMREYHALSELRHPRIIEVYDYGVDRGTPYYTMELLDGSDLNELSPVPWPEACRYLRDVASSLALLHARRLLHRDVSPRNVRRTSTGNCKLLDFGAMVPFGVQANLTGTPPCIPPEALQGAPLDGRADLYSLGALGYSILTGQHAYPVREIAALPNAWKHTCANPRRIVREIPAALDELVMSLMSMDPVKRPSSAAEVIDRLSAIAELEPDDTTDVARSFLAGSRLVAREVACVQLRQHVLGTLAGRGSAVLISGESGSGRSRMAAEAARLGQTCGLTVVRAAARETHGASPALLTDLLLGLHQAAPLEAERAGRTQSLLAAGRDEVSRTPQRPDANSGTARAQLLAEVIEMFKQVARSRPLLIIVDDLDRADELSGALVAALAYHATGSALSLVAAYECDRDAPVLANVRGLATVLPLPPLDRQQTLALVESLFGEVPNLERVSDWMFRIAAGSPKLTLELADHLLARGIVRYVEGTWVLPAEIAEPLPRSTTAALMLRVDAVSPTARSLAEVLCLARGGATAASLLDLAHQTSDSVFSGLEELVRACVVVSAGDAYVFAQDAVRKELYRSLQARRRRELHTRWAEHLLALPPDRDTQLEAGWHLVHTDHEMRGADLLAKLGPELVEQRISMAAAIPAMERALEVYERRNGPLAERLRLRAMLVMSSYLFDHRLAARYGRDTLDALYPFTGLAETERLSRWFGKPVGFALGLGWAMLRWCLRRPSRRGPHVLAALLYYGRSTMGLAGLRALTLDAPGAQDVLDRVRAFEGAPHPTSATIFSLTKAIARFTAGNATEIDALVEEIIVHLQRRWTAFHLSLQDRLDLMVGVLLLGGINECYRERSNALEYADRLEQLNTPLGNAAALRVRMTYHGLRGERERTLHYRRLLDLNAIQNGTFWQVEWIALPIEGLAGVTWTDLVAQRRALDALDSLVAEVPTFASLRDSIRICYNYRRGDYAAAVKFGEEYLREHAPFTVLAWAVTYAMTALSYLELGQSERALEICEGAMAIVKQRPRKYVLHYMALEAAQATALALLGQRARAEQLFDALVAEQRAAAEYTRACLLHEYRVKVARMLGDRPALQRALDEMREDALASRNPTLIVLADRAAELRAAARSSPLPPAREASAADEAAALGADETAVTMYLQQEDDREARAARALQILGEYAGCGEGYLFWQQRGRLALAASLDLTRPVPPNLEELLSHGPANEGSYSLALGDDYDLHYRVFPLDLSHRAQRERPPLIVLRELAGKQLDVPAGLLADVSRALNEAAETRAS